jgi:hypothetical protein
MPSISIERFLQDASKSRPQRGGDRWLENETCAPPKPSDALGRRARADIASGAAAHDREALAAPRSPAPAGSAAPKLAFASGQSGGSIPALRLRKKAGRGAQ